MGGKNRPYFNAHKRFRYLLRYYIQKETYERKIK